LTGLGRKVFTAGEVLQAADVNGYLMDQSVMYFAGTAARGSAIPTPTAGMLTFIAASSAVQVYDGVEWVEIAGSSNVADDTIQPNFNTITNNYEFVDGYNGVSAGPITISAGATVTVGTASAWSIV
jgi:hypothetical protein